MDRSSSGKRRKHPFPKVGARFGTLTVSGEPVLMARVNQNLRMIPCRCDCGHEDLFLWANMREGRSRACRLCAPKNAGRSLTKPRPVCACGKACMCLRSTYCMECGKLSNVGKSWAGYPLVMREVGDILGITKQAAHMYLQMHGVRKLMDRVNKAKAGAKS